jgi:FkbM family methyltransferase
MEMQRTYKVPDVFADWTREKAIEEYEALVSALQYTIGERERLKALWRLIEQNLGKANDGLMARLMQALTTSPSERYQDIFALLLTRKFTDGFFVEFGACDGIAASNTFILEKDFGWTGILAEPGRVWQKKLSENRAAKIDTRCVTASTGDLVNFNEGVDARVSSTDPSHKYLRQIKNTYSVQTVSLMDLLKDHDAPRYIDFLSIDIEGGEHAALEGLDFGKYSFGFICIEQHDHISAELDLSEILHSAGYREIFPRSPDKTKPPHMQVTGIDLFFLPSDSPYFI